MFKTKPHNQILTNVNSVNNSYFDIPIICPNCNYSLSPIIKDHRLINYGNSKLLFVNSLYKYKNVNRTYFS